jgi:hypothetical protein
MMTKSLLEIQTMTVSFKFSNLKFIGDGADFINLAFELYDVMAEIKLTKYERHPRTG